MFEIGFSEMLVIAVVALVVLGPERLPKAARFTGLWIRRARAQWDSVKSDLERELAAEEIKRNIADTEKAIRDGRAQLHQQLHDAGTAASDGVAAIKADLHKGIDGETGKQAAEPEPAAASADRHN